MFTRVAWIREGEKDRRLLNISLDATEVDDAPAKTDVARVQLLHNINL